MRLILLLTLIPALSVGQNLYWSDTITVNNDLASGYARPRITLANNVPVIVWGKANNLAVYSSRLSGTGFSDPVMITPQGVNSFVQSWAGPSLDAKGDTVFIAFKAQPENAGMIYVVRSVDGGVTFGDTVRVSDENWSRFAEVTVADGGHPQVAWMQFDPNFLEPYWVVAKSTDGGNSFLPFVPANGVAPGEACDCCPGAITTDAGKTAMMFRNNDNDLRDAWLSVSTNNGATFTASADVDTNNWIAYQCPASGPDGVINGDSITIVWMSGGAGGNRVNIASVHMGNLGVGFTSQITPGAGISQNYPRIDGRGDTLGMVWQEYSSGNGLDVYFAWSVTGAAGLLSSPVITVNKHTAYTQQNPDIAFHNGKFHITWQDNNTQSVVYRDASFSALSVKSHPKTQTLTIYPNPALDHAIIELPEGLSNASLSVSDISGKRIFVTQGINTHRYDLPLRGFPAGVYLVTVESNAGTFTSRLLVK